MNFFLSIFNSKKPKSLKIKKEEGGLNIGAKVIHFSFVSYFFKP
jgi:hypothetical protein